MELKGSVTEQNLLTAFAGESQARNRYDFFAKKAKAEGFEQISKVFEETALQEKAHASRLFKLMPGGTATITASYPAGGNGTTYENLLAAAGGEGHEYMEMYPSFAAKAREEGFTEIATILEAIAVAEQQHGARYQRLADNIKNGTVFAKKKKTAWQCRNCGYMSKGKEAPTLCPACAHPKSYFEVQAENY
jgi:rubrerythrin